MDHMEGDRKIGDITFAPLIDIHKSSLVRRFLVFMLQSFDLSHHIKSLKMDLMIEIKTLHHKKVRTSLSNNHF